ncbi:MAG: enoyl-CoA hydratase/isomerase family protein [Chloroflexi bacterium]|nr:enoyl-CoA hydratase/isomerase family protein [Chloroflexota bacterium]
MHFQHIIYTKEQGIATITLNQPRTLNAFTKQMGDEWIVALRDAKDDPDVRVVMVTGAGRAFCAGGNPRDLLASREYYRKAQEPPFMLNTGAITHHILDMDKPYIGVINGPCVGGGMEMVNLCDFRIASDQAKFSVAFVRMGEVPTVLGCYMLPRIVGLPMSLELMWTGRLFDAEEALRIGYVNRVVPLNELMPAALELAGQLARGPYSIRLMKRLAYRCLDMDLEQALVAHRESVVLACASEDAMEGPRAWIEKREPMFRWK